MARQYYYYNSNKFPILITQKTQEITPYTFRPNGELWENKSLHQFFKCFDTNKSYTVADIGAQSGLYSLFAKYLPKTTFYSFEPFNETFNLLNDNLELNNISNVKTYNIGISNQKETAILNTCMSNNGLNTLGTNLTRFTDNKQITIETDTLDNLFYHKNIPVHFIKIDTEGWEYNILKGGELTIKKYNPVIQMEWNLTNMIQCSVNEEALYKLLTDYGYYEKSMVEEEKLFFPMNYLNFNIPDNCTHCKIDVGLSYSAPHAQKWLATEPSVMVFGFEPNPDSVNCIMNGNIQKRHPGHGQPLDQKFIDEGRFCLVPKALSNVDKEETMDFYVNTNDCGTSSLFKHDEIGLGPIKQHIKVPVISLKMFFDKFPWDKFEYIDYIKIDAQGSDLNILKGAGNYLRDKVVYVTAEPDGYQYFDANECNEQNIVQYMNSQGFTQIKHPNTIDPTFINNKFLYLRNDIFIAQI
jgi:FkbM family methyltransferase